MTAEKQESVVQEVSETGTQDRSPAKETSQSVTAATDAPIESAAEKNEALSERDVFAGDEDLYRVLAASGGSDGRTKVSDTGAGIMGVLQSVFKPLSRLVPGRLKRFSTLQKTLLVLIALVTGLLVYSLVKSPVSIKRPKPPSRQVIRHSGGQQPISKQPARRNPETADSENIPAQAVSLRTAEQMYLEGNYKQAYKIYERLGGNLAKDQDEEVIKDFLQLRLAMCLAGTANRASAGKQTPAIEFDEAAKAFKALLQSRSPLVRIMANCQLGLIELEKKQYLSARSRAYQVIGLMGTLNPNDDWASAMERDGHFMAAAATTCCVLSLRDADKDLPDHLWSRKYSETNPFANIDEAQLPIVLMAGAEQLAKAVLGPGIRKLEGISGSEDSALSRWAIVCEGASFEEMMARFAARAGLEVRWAVEGSSSEDGAGRSIGRKPVYLCMPAATAEQVISTAAGSIGLLARLDANGIVNLYNPERYSSLLGHIELLNSEAVSGWVRFILAFREDKRLADAHLAKGLLASQQGAVSDAMAEYKLVANQFSRTPLAPYALVQSSRLKTDLHDYAGASEDLRQLVEMYPDNELSSQACLYLAEATQKTGDRKEAFRLYRKVYDLGSSTELRIAAALGAGKCCYEVGDYNDAITWLVKHIELAAPESGPQLSGAYYLLGKSNQALARSKQAREAFQYALALQKGTDSYIEIVLTLAEEYMQQEKFVEAINLLDDACHRQVSNTQLTELSLLKAHVLREMGLVEKAIILLAEREPYISDAQLKAKIARELAMCRVAKGDLVLAQKTLSDAMVLAEHGDLAHQIAVELADVCLRLNQASEVISICLQVLGQKPSERVKQKALELLSAGYNHRKEFDKAALALMGKWDAGPSENGPVKVEGPLSLNAGSN